MVDISIKEYKRQINKFIEVPLSDRTILTLLPKSNIIIYNQLAKFWDLEQIFGKDGSCIILYQTSENFGHWICIFKRSQSELEIFDSLGYLPDNELKFVPEKLFKGPLLTNLITKGRYSWTFNPYRFQEDNSSNTCGKWCVLRIKLRKLKLDQFKKLFTSKDAKKVGSPDFIVSTFYAMCEAGLL